jgi:UTP--glucose-1-phosphate uridylyltransferase
MIENSRSVKKAIIAAAGLGTRFLPATKSVPKELLPVIDKPVIEYITEECVQSGIEDIIIVTRYGGSAIEDYLDSSAYLENILREKSKNDYLNKIQHAYRKANFIFIRQPAHIPYGTSAPLLVAKNLISKGESFAFLYGDDLFISSKPALKQLVDQYKSSDCKAVIGASTVPESEVSKYGVFDLKDNGKGEKVLIDLVEKPTVGRAPTNLVNVGRHIYHSDIIDHIEKQTLSSRGELELTDAIKSLSETDSVLVNQIDGEWLTTGDPLSMLKANLMYALESSEYREGAKKILRSIASSSD